MNRISANFSLLFFLAALVSICWGFQIIRLNSKSKINRMFLLMCIALSIWSFGFAMANSQTSLSAALFWRRYSAIGWTSIFNIILHFLLLATSEKDRNHFNKYLFLIYLPAIINMYVFALSNNMAPNQYNLVKIDYGWTNIAINRGWDIFYYLYYSLYMMASIFVVWRWSRSIRDKTKVKQARFVLLAIIIATIPGAIIDLSVNTFLDKPLPQMAPLFILFPVWSMYYFAKYYNILGVEKAKREELIITSQQQEQIFISFSIAIMISGILSFLFEYYSASSNNMGNLRISLLTILIQEIPHPL